MGKLPDSKYARYYTKNSAEGFLKKYARKLGNESLVLFYKLWFTLTDGKASPRTIALILAALGYGVCPIDAIPDFIPVLGLTDDAAVLAATAVSVASDITPETTKKAEKKAREILGFVGIYVFRKLIEKGCFRIQLLTLPMRIKKWKHPSYLRGNLTESANFCQYINTRISSMTAWS